MAVPEPADGAPAAATPRGGRNLPVAIGVGLGLAGAYIGSLLLEPVLFLVFVAVNVVIALYELDGAFARTKARPPTIVAAVAAPVMLLGTYWWGPDVQVHGLYVALLAGFVVVLVTNAAGHAVSRMAALALMLVWVVVAASSLAMLLRRPDGHWYVLAGTALTVTNDIGAYAFGRNFGRHRIAPAVSPGKTWEGFAGAMATTLLMAALVTTRTVPGVDLVPALALAAAVVVAATLGDFAESLVKRDLGIKDLGGIFPGHGGVMDRIDALLFALPVTHLVLLAFGI
ncbi:phosphatidate cytidylyltransferase [Euzebya rosea]|uniref:phosphatidate cytidylyltransferase n=1 Tax=Euzebya rosea TaxID=2052804 RepID=UPI000D3EAE43|nr:phosphatidate cytidylyltransferase [Euzebya rosea]